MKNLLGGKGANLAEMAGHKNLKLPVPPGFTVTTEVCTYYYDNNKTYPKDLEKQIKTALAEVEKLMGKKFGDVKDPLLMSVRSGARKSMAQVADFVSFGTNDLTQMSFGFSRDDIGGFLPKYLDLKLLPEDPFVSIDQTGVGELVKIGVEKGRSIKPQLKVGICGEHGGDPESVKFCHKLGLNYVSCSPFRVPIARLAAAQAAIEQK